MARPSDYNNETALNICALIAEGSSLVSICKNEDMPSTVTVYAWLQKHEEFLNIYTRAREDQADTLADQIIDIADEASTTVKSQDGFTEVVFDNTAIARNRLRVEARKWVAAKLKPKKYGDKIEATHKGSVTLSLTETDAEL